MNDIRFTLISDGSSDKVLMNIIKWLLDDLFPTTSFIGSYADLRVIPKRIQLGDVAKRIYTSYEYYPFDILFYHRDAESTDIKIIEERIKEITDNLSEKYKEITICVIPVKMMETWLLFDVNAIKLAAGNRNYSGEINLPALNVLEKKQQPKEILHQILREVSGKKSRNLKNFNVHQAVHFLGEFIEDFSALRQLSSFQKFEIDLKVALDKLLLKTTP